MLYEEPLGSVAAPIIADSVSRATTSILDIFNKDDIRMSRDAREIARLEADAKKEQAKMIGQVALYGGIGLVALAAVVIIAKKKRKTK